MCGGRLEPGAGLAGKLAKGQTLLGSWPWPAARAATGRAVAGAAAASGPSAATARSPAGRRGAVAQMSPRGPGTAAVQLHKFPNLCDRTLLAVP
jgi:hypothetical protein